MRPNEPNIEQKYLQTHTHTHALTHMQYIECVANTMTGPCKAAAGR